MSRAVAQSSVVVVDIGPTWIMPALLTTISTRSKRCVAAYGLPRTCTLRCKFYTRTSSPLLGLVLPGRGPCYCVASAQHAPQAVSLRLTAYQTRYSTREMSSGFTADCAEHWPLQLF